MTEETLKRYLAASEIYLISFTSHVMSAHYLLSLLSLGRLWYDCTITYKGRKDSTASAL